MEHTIDDAAESRTVNIATAARMLGISERHAYEMARTGRIPALRFGKRYVIPKSAMAALLGERPAVTA